jgi:hypothetical protein
MRRWRGRRIGIYVLNKIHHEREEVSWDCKGLKSKWA